MADMSWKDLIGKRLEIRFATSRETGKLVGIDEDLGWIFIESGDKTFSFPLKDIRRVELLKKK
jgi:hypothetical protein